MVALHFTPAAQFWCESQRNFKHTACALVAPVSGWCLERTDEKPPAILLDFITSYAGNCWRSGYLARQEDVKVLTLVGVGSRRGCRSWEGQSEANDWLWPPLSGTDLQNSSEEPCCLLHLSNSAACSSFFFSKCLQEQTCFWPWCLFVMSQGALIPLPDGLWPIILLCYLLSKMLCFDFGDLCSLLADRVRTTCGRTPSCSRSSACVPRCCSATRTLARGSSTSGDTK